MTWKHTVKVSYMEVMLVQLASKCYQSASVPKILFSALTQKYLVNSYAINLF